MEILWIIDDSSNCNILLNCNNRCQLIILITRITAKVKLSNTFNIWIGDMVVDGGLELVLNCGFP